MPANEAPTATILPPLTPTGTEERVNSTVAGVQHSAAVAAIAGGHVVVWQSSDGVHAQRYDAAGAAAGEPILVSDTIGIADPAVAAVGDGFVLAWSAPDGDGIAAIFTQRFDASGAAEGPLEQVSAPSLWDSLDPGIAALGDGGYFVSWTRTFSGDGGSGSDVYGRRYTAAGVAADDEVAVSASTIEQRTTATAAFADGGYVVAWVALVGDVGTILVSRYDAAGGLLGGATVASADYAGNPVVTALADGGFVVAWDGLGPADDGDVFLQRFDASGVPAGDQVRTTGLGGNQYSPSVAALADGGFVLVYVGGSADDYPGIFAQRYWASGAPMGGQVLINTTTAGDQSRPSVAALGEGYVVTWQGNGSGDSDGVFARQVVPGDIAVTEQVAFDLKQRLQVADADAGSGVVTAVIAVGYGVLHVEAGTSGATVSGNDSGEVTITGTIDQINALLGTDSASVVAFTANTDAPPASTQLTLTVDDGGNTGDGGPLTASTSRTIAIAAVNDAPALVHNARLTPDEGVEATITAAMLEFDDADQPDTAITYTLVSAAFNGALRLNGVTVAQNGTFTQDDINHGRVTFLHDGSETGFANFAFSVSDGAGGVVASQSFEILVTPVNDAPVFSGLDATPTAVEQYVDIFLDPDATVFDAELAASGNYDGATLTVARAGGADPSDRFYLGGVSIEITGDDDDELTSYRDSTYFTIGTIAQANGQVTITFNSAANQFDVDAVLRQLQYRNVGDAPPASVTIGFTFSDGNTIAQGTGGAKTATGSVTVAITPVDDPAVLKADLFMLDENGVATGNLFADNGNGADVDVDGPALTIATVNTSAANVGTQITLASGALVTVNADGSFEFDPNGAYDYLPGPASGASNRTAVAGFVYSANGQGTLVSFIVRGVDGDDLLRGTSGNDTLDGGIGANTMSYVDAGAGVTVALDTTRAQNTVGAGTDRLANIANLTGSNFADQLGGNAGANRLDGGTGADRMQGGLGDDVYVVDNAGDRIKEAAGQGTDTVETSVDYTLPGLEVERAVATGSGAVDITGNAIANALIGNGAVNWLYGAGGDDRVDGGGGADVMAGGLGNDIFVVDDAGDRIKENAAQGTDTVEASIAFSLLGLEVENLTLTGAGAIDGTGNGYANLLIGNGAANALFGYDGADDLRGGGGDDALRGMAGNDVLEGGEGADRFYFDATLDAATNVDTIADFEVGIDAIWLRQAKFDGMALGALSAAAFVVGTQAADAGDRIIYDAITGALYFDPDGTGIAAAVRFATLDPGLALTNADFTVF